MVRRNKKNDYFECGKSNQFNPCLDIFLFFIYHRGGKYILYGFRENNNRFKLLLIVELGKAITKLRFFSGRNFQHFNKKSVSFPFTVRD